MQAAVNPAVVLLLNPERGAGQNLSLMRLIDERPSDLETSFFGVRQMIWFLRNDGHLGNESASGG